MSTRHCEECWAVLDPAVLRCTKCKMIFYCSKACQKRNWRIHKRVCSTDPSLRRFLPVEMAVERALAKQPPMEQAPTDARCYICLEGDGASASSKLMRGCACRGDSAGFVHIECLTKLAMSKEASGVFNSWLRCGNCKQFFELALDLEMKRRFWRCHRSSIDMKLRYGSTQSLASALGNIREVAAANQLLDEASTCVGNNRGMLLDLKLDRVDMLSTNGQKLEALGRLQAVLPEAKAYTAIPSLYGRTMHQLANVLIDLDRDQEAHEAASELVAFNKAKFGLENPVTLQAMGTYAVACAKLGRIEEAKANFEDVLATQTRVLGPDHLHTILTLRDMVNFGFASFSG